MKKYFILIIGILFSVPLFSCNGCASYDYNTIQTKTYIGAHYYQRYHKGLASTQGEGTFLPSRLRSTHGGGSEDNNIYTFSDDDYEMFRRLDVRFNYNLKEKYNLTIVVPIVQNDDYYARVINERGEVFDTISRYQGLGDVFLGVHAVKNVDKKIKKHTVKYGIGFFLPTGDFSITDDEGNVIDPSHQPGRGSLSALLTLKYAVFWHEKWGLSMATNYLKSTKSKRANNLIGDQIEYHFGDQFNLFVDGVYVFNWVKYKLIPKVGVYYEHVQKDKLNKVDKNDTGGSAAFLNIGIDFKWKDIIFQVNTRKPIWESLYGNQLRNANIFSFGVLVGI